MAQTPGRHFVPGEVPAVVASLPPLGRLPGTNQLHLTIGLPLRNQPELDELIHELYDPASPDFRHFITPQEFTARFGPSESDYAALLAFARTNGFEVVGTHPNRVIVDLVGTVDTVERVFAVNLKTYRHPKESRDFFAPDKEPSVAAPVTLLSVSGLDNFSLPHPNVKPRPAAAQSAVAPSYGSGSGGSYIGNDFRAAYVPGTTLTGAGQSVGLVQFDGYYANDITNYISQAGINTSVTLVNVPINGGVPTPGSGSIEVSLDIEMAIAMAPGLSKIYVYEGPNGGVAWSTILSKMANDNLAKQLSCSWGGGSPDATSEQIFKQMAAQGQSFFNATGDSDAFTGSISFPSDSTNITQVGGTTLSTTGAGGSYASETVWNWGGGTGSSGGVSTYYKIPSWQTTVSMAASGGSTTYRNTPDVALTADNIYVAYNNGSGGSVGGTSCAAPLWAGYCALINQQAALAAKPPVGFLNPALYAMVNTAGYSTNFHDVTTGNNTSSTSPSQYYAVAGYDLCTGLGTPNGMNLINALVPLSFAPTITGAGWTLLAESAMPTNGAIDPGETVTVNFTLQNNGNLATSNLVATLQPNAGVLAPGGSQRYGVIAASGGSASYSFTFTAAGYCGSNILAVLQLQDGMNNLGTVSFNLPLGKPMGFAQNFDGVTAPNLPTGWTTANIIGTAANWVATAAASDTSPNSAFIADPANAGENALVSPQIFISGTNSQLSFRHNYNLDYTTAGSGQKKTYTCYDGGVLEIQIGNNPFADILAAGGSFITGGYTRSITNSLDNPLGGRAAWGASSGNWTSVIVKLPASAAGQNIRLRWNCASDTGNTGSGPAGWYVDSVAITDTAADCLTVLADLAVSQSAATGSWTPGQNLAYTLTVTNLGPQSAANVMLTDTVPANMTFVSASPGCTYSAGQIICPVGMLAVAGATNLTVTLKPAGAGVFTNLVNVGTVTPEFTTANNSASLVSTLLSATPPSITGGLAGQLVECGGNAGFTISAAGSQPLSIQWSLDNVPVTDGTNLSLQLSNVHLPDHQISVTVTNLYGSVTGNAVLSVHDSLPPLITLNGANPMFVEFGTPFSDPGATANDACAGVLPVTTTGVVNVNSMGTNTLVYTVADGNGNASQATRTVIVHETTPPVITWSFTNLVLAAGNNCGATMPDVTGTNFIRATDMSPPLAISQVPVSGADLLIGTNLVVMTVSDLYSNLACSTNCIVVQDQTPPLILTQPMSQTNAISTVARFSVVATACTPLSFQWFFGTNALDGQTNSTVTLSNLSVSVAGNYSVIATASGGSSTSTAATLTVSLLPTTIALTSSRAPSGFKDGLTFTASLLPSNAAGTVRFFTNGTTFDVEPVLGGQAVSTNLASLPRGTNLIAVVYSGDASYLPSTNSFDQIVTNHPPVASAASYTTTAGLSLNLPISDLAKNWSDLDHDSLSLVGVSISTNGITLQNTGKLLIYSNTNSGVDQFTCTITDGFGGTNFQTVIITSLPPVDNMPRITSLVTSGNGAMTLSLGGAPGFTYVLEATGNFFPMDPWLSIATNTLDASGLWQFTDPQAGNYTQRFYRLELVP